MFMIVTAFVDIQTHGCGTIVILSECKTKTREWDSITIWVSKHFGIRAIAREPRNRAIIIIHLLLIK